MKKQKVFFVFLFVVLITISGAFKLSGVHSESYSEIEKAVSYLKSQTQTAWSSMALAANNEQTIDLSHLQSVSQDQNPPASYAKNILALAANGKNPAVFGNEDYIEKLKSYFVDNQFGDKNLLNDDVWAILALGAVGQEYSSQAQAAKDYLLAHQNLDGGWSYSLTSDSSTNDTAAAIMALIEAGVERSSVSIQKAVSYLKSKQKDDGGFAYSDSSPSDSCSDAWVIAAIYKLKQNPTAQEWTKNSSNPLSHLKSFQAQDGGFWWQKEGDNKFCSPYAVLALFGKTFPVESSFNRHKLRIEGEAETICSVEVLGGTAMDLIISGADICGYTYTIVEYPGLGLYLSNLAGKTDWMYLVDNFSPSLGAADYYLDIGEEVLWHCGTWLDNGWYPTRVLIAKTEDQAVVSVEYFSQEVNDWQALNQKTAIQVGENEMVSESGGTLTLNFAAFSGGLYPVFVKRQIISNVGYIRSAKENLTIGQVPQGHQVGLRVEIETTEAPPEGRQESISFSIFPDLLDFGKLKAGESSVKELTFSNGNSNIYLQAEAAGDAIFRDNLEIDNVASKDFSSEAEANQQKIFKVGLTVPFDYSGEVGIRQGTLTFWATIK